MQLETIKTLAAKLRAISAADSGASENERRIAADKLQALLTKNNITLQDIFSEEKIHEFYTECDTKQELKLVNQIMVVILGEGTTYRKGKRSITTSSSKKQKRVTTIRVSDLTLSVCIDLRNCWTHYRNILHETTASLEQERKAIANAINHAATGVIQKHKIFPEQTEEDADKPYKQPTLAELQAMMTAMKHATGQKWQKPEAHISMKGFHLEYSA
jgi:hypothetical protein